MSDTNFQSKWYRAVVETESLLVVGIDPPQELSGVALLEWCQNLIDDTKDFAVAYKVNPTFIIGKDIEEGLARMLQDVKKEKGVVLIYDRKFPEIGKTNNAGFLGAASLGYDAVTIAPYAGNMEQAVQQCHELGLGCIPVILMSNPEYIVEAEYSNPQTGVSLWRDRLEIAKNSGADAIVLGGNLYLEDEQKKLLEQCLRVAGTELLFLAPGFGRQGGEIEKFLELVTGPGYGIKPRRFMPSWSSSFGEEADRAKRRELARQIRDFTRKYIVVTDSEILKIKNAFWK